MKEKFWLDIDENRFLKFMELLWKFKIPEAFMVLIWWTDALSEAKESDEFYTNLTGKLNVDLKADSKLSKNLNYV